MSERRYLDVKYKDRDLAIRLGARFCNQRRLFWVADGTPLAEVFKWADDTAPKAEQAPPESLE